MRNAKLFVKGSVGVLLLLGHAAAWAAEAAQSTNAPPAAVTEKKEQAPEPAAKSGPPLPVHTTEGYGGGAITPTAYLVNPGPKGQVFGLPAFPAPT